MIREGRICELCDEVGLPYDSEEGYAFCPVHAMAMKTDASIDNFTINIEGWVSSVQMAVHAGETIYAHPLCSSCHASGIPRHNNRWAASRRATVTLCTHHAVSQILSQRLLDKDSWLRQIWFVTIQY